jgi:hypothetical protein
MRKGRHEHSIGTIGLEFMIYGTAFNFIRLKDLIDMNL